MAAPEECGAVNLQHIRATGRRDACVQIIAAPHLHKTPLPKPAHR